MPVQVTRAVGSTGPGGAGVSSARAPHNALPTTPQWMAIETTTGDALLQREIRQAARLARHGAWRLCRRHGLPCPDPASLRADLSDTITEQAAVWNERSRPGGLEDSLARLRARLSDYD